MSLIVPDFTIYVYSSSCNSFFFALAQSSFLSLTISCHLLHHAMGMPVTGNRKQGTKIRPKKRRLYEVPYTEIVKSGTIRLASALNICLQPSYITLFQPLTRCRRSACRRTKPSAAAPDPALSRTASSVTWRRRRTVAPPLCRPAILPVTTTTTTTATATRPSTDSMSTRASVHCSTVHTVSPTNLEREGEAHSAAATRRERRCSGGSIPRSFTEIVKISVSLGYYGSWGGLKRVARAHETHSSRAWMTMAT